MAGVCACQLQLLLHVQSAPEIPLLLTAKSKNTQHVPQTHNETWLKHKISLFKHVPLNKRNSINYHYRLEILRICSTLPMPLDKGKPEL